MKKYASFILSLTRKSWIIWYIIKFKDAYLVLLCGKLIENLLTRMKLKTLQTLWKLDYLRFFWNYLDVNYVFQSICNLWALCGFNTMSCVISWWSPNLVFIVFVTMESNPGECPFTSYNISPKRGKHELESLNACYRG